MNSGAFTAHPLIWVAAVKRDEGEFACMNGSAQEVAQALENTVMAGEAAASSPEPDAFRSIIVRLVSSCMPRLFVGYYSPELSASTYYI